MGEHERSEDRRTVPRDERAEGPIEKGLADELDIGEVQEHAVGGFQRLGNLVVDVLGVDAQPHPRAIITHADDLHGRVTHGRAPIVASPCAAPFGPSATRPSIGISPFSERCDSLAGLG